jgi:hypothetical protein
MTKMTEEKLIAAASVTRTQGNYRERYHRRRGCLAHHRKGARPSRWRGSPAGRQPIRIGLVAMSTGPQCDQLGIFRTTSTRTPCSAARRCSGIALLKAGVVNLLQAS